MGGGFARHTIFKGVKDTASLTLVCKSIGGIEMTKRTIALVGAMSGAIILATAAAANYSTSNGYGVLKNSLLGMRGLENYTLNLGVKVNYDDVELYGVSSAAEVADNGANAYTKSDNYAYDAPNSTYSYERWSQDGKEISHTSNGNYYSWESAYGINPLSKTILTGSEEQDAKIIRFAELLTDTFVGDLKNNVTYTGGDDDCSNYSISLDSIQIPELINAGVSLAFSTITYENNIDSDNDEILPMIASLGNDAYTESINGSFRVNSDNSFRDGTISATLAGKDDNGEVHRMTITMELALSNVGTTVPHALSEEEMNKVQQYLPETVDVYVD